MGRAVEGLLKELMLAHALGVMDCIRVELRADASNARSRTAIARLGAREDGRTVDYSILRHEWPGVRAGLEAKLASHHPL